MGNCCKEGTKKGDKNKQPQNFAQDDKFAFDQQLAQANPGQQDQEEKRIQALKAAEERAEKEKMKGMPNPETRQQLEQKQKTKEKLSKNKESSGKEANKV